MAITNKIGPPVSGDDFYGREQELRNAHKILDTKHSIVLSAPRRIGKSSFAKRLVEEKAKENWKSIYIDLENIRSQEDFLKLLSKEFDRSEIWKKGLRLAEETLFKLLNGVKEIASVKLDFQFKAEWSKLYTLLAESLDHSQDTLIVIDELTLFLDTLEKSDKTADIAFFLNWFRGLRQISDTNIRWIFCGSIGLDNFTSSRNLSYTINDLVRLDFDVLQEEEAKGLLRALAASDLVELSEENISFMLELLGWNIPYFIQLLYKTIKEQYLLNKELTPEIITECFENLSKQSHLNTWSERLSEYNEMENGARNLLNLISSFKEGVNKSSLVNSYISFSTTSDPLLAEMEVSRILNMLEHDGYLIRNESKRRFRSPLLRKWWYYKFVE